MKTLKCALQPAVKDVSLTWNLPKTWTAETVPAELPTVFHGNQLVMFGLLSRKDAPSRTSITAIEGTVTLNGQIDNGSSVIRHVLKFSAVCGNPAESSLLLHRLCAKASIMEQDNDSHFIQLSKSANIISKLTSFVAVDKQTGVVVSRPLEAQAARPMNSGTMFGFYGNMGGAAFARPSQAPAAQPVGFSNMGGAVFSGPSRPPIAPPTGTFGDMGGAALGRPPRPPGYTSFSSGSVNHSAPRVPPRHSSSKLLGFMDKQSSPSDKNHSGQQTYLSLIGLQTASGAWQPTDKLARMCGKTLPDILTTCPTQLHQDNKDILWATALALAYLNENFSDQKDEWEIAATKAMKWLKTNLTKEDYETIMYWASRWISKTLINR